MESDRAWSPREWSYKDLERFTDGFSAENFIGYTMFGKLYRGKISDEQNGMEAQEVTVKIWFAREIYWVKPEDQIGRAKEEIWLLQQDKLNSHPNLGRLIGYCCEDEQAGVVYDLKPLNTVYNLISEKSFTWMQRIKVAVQFACLIDFFHNEKHNSLAYMVRNIGPTHILLDKEFCPKFIDLGMLSGGLVPDRRDIEDEKQFGCYGHSDYVLSSPGCWRTECDVFAFGSLLVSLFCKRVFREKDDLCFDDFPFTENVDWLQETYTPKFNSYTEKYPRGNCSLVHESFKTDEGFYHSDAVKLTKIMIQCTAFNCESRPTMKEVVESLLKLRVVRKFADELGLKHILHRRRRSVVLKSQLRDGLKSLRRMKYSVGAMGYRIKRQLSVA